jgi:hypothetical protein
MLTFVFAVVIVLWFQLTGAVLQKYKPAQTDQLFEQLKRTIVEDDKKLTR